MAAYIGAMRFHGRRSILRHLHPARLPLLRLGLLLFYLPLVATLDLHHNHGVELPPAHPELAAPPCCEDPCPVTLLQLAHGDEHAETPLSTVLSRLGPPPDEAVVAPWHAPRRGVVVRGPPSPLPV